MKLIFTSGPLADNRYAVDRDITIGRDVSNDIVLPDKSASLVHCQIFYQADRPFIKDLGSTNGTKINGERIVQHELCDGDCLSVGTSVARVEIPEVAEQSGTISVSMPDAHATVATSPVTPATIHAPATENAAGNIFGSVTYLLKRKIASGGMGSIYEAEQFGAEGFIKKVAIKTILPDYAQKESFVSSFIGEAKLVANLVHQNIVQIHHLGRHEDGYFIVMEYIDGINLTDFIRKHFRLHLRIPVDIATFIVSRICRGLEYAHNKRGDDGTLLNLVHRDVSPNNIMMTREGEVKLTDFGVAKATQFMDNDDEYIVGSVEYMSPEQAAGDPVDQRSDVFSLGLVYYELLTGKRVFQCKNDNIEAGLEHVKKALIPDPLTLRNDLPADVVATLNRCLQRDPDKRYASAMDCVLDLEHSIYAKGYGLTIKKLAMYIESLGGWGKAHPSSSTVAI